jgi:hypothetical protein
LHYASIFQSLCEWKFKGLVEQGEHRCCPFTTQQRASLVKAMSPFVALKPAAPLTVSVPPFFVKDRLNCETARWGGSNFFTGAPRTKIPLVVDVFIVASEMDLMESRMYELSESVDYVVVGISPKNHRGDPQPNWFAHARDEQHRFTPTMLSKILLVDVGLCDAHKAAQNDVKATHNNHGSEWEHQLTQRDCLWKHGMNMLRERLQKDLRLKDIEDDTVFLFTDVDEIPERQLVYHVKHCELRPKALPAHLRMRVNGHNFRVPCTNGKTSFTGASEMSEWKTIKEDDGVIYRFRAPPHLKKRQKNAIHDAGVHLTWYGSMAFVDYKGFTHAEGGYMTPMWDAEGIHAGDYCDAQKEDHNHRLSQRQRMANERPLKFVRFWERHPEPPLVSVLPSAPPLTSTTERQYECRLPWVAVENPLRFTWFWGEGKAEQIDALADATVLNYFPKENDGVVATVLNSIVASLH